VSHPVELIPGIRLAKITQFDRPNPSLLKEIGDIKLPPMSRNRLKRHESAAELDLGDIVGLAPGTATYRRVVLLLIGAARGAAPPRDKENHPSPKS
jgi:hypothetical protein